jgi:glucokinase
LEIGGSHVTAALVAIESAEVLKRCDLPVEPDADRETLLDQFVAAGLDLGAEEGGNWGVAIPGPFDYSGGIGRFQGVGKFESLRGYDLGAALRSRLLTEHVRFVNDAIAFGLGEAYAGAARHYQRALCITLGTGVGSAFVAGRKPVISGPNVPPEGFVHHLKYRGKSLEDFVSRRALRADYRHATGTDLDVQQIAELVRSGDGKATNTWNRAMTVLTTTIAPWAKKFGAEVVVVGGSIAKSWDLVEPGLIAGFSAAAAPVNVVPAELADEAALFGAAHWAVT